jgi:hypothetical protein
VRVGPAVVVSALFLLGAPPLTHSLLARTSPAVATGPVGQAQAPAVAVGLAGGMDDEGHGVALQVDNFGEVDDDIEVALVVNEIPKDGVDARPVREVDLTVDADDHGPACPADGEGRRGAQGPPGVFEAARGASPLFVRPARRRDQGRE